MTATSVVASYSRCSVTTSRLRTPGGILLAALLLAIGCWTAWLSFKAAAINIMPPTDPRLTTWAGKAPEVALDRAMVEFVTGRGAVSPATMATVGEAAKRAPLDARPFLLFAVRDLVRRPDAPVIPVLEAGRRLDGRQRWIRLLLLDRYIRAGRVDQGAREFTVLARLVTSAQAPILTELARLASAPETRPAVRRALARDPALERSLLSTLASSNPDPALLFSIASPGARASAGVPGGWGQKLVEAMVQRGQYIAARTVWQRIYGLSAADAAQLLYDAGLRGLPGSPPFNWSLASGAIGAVDLHGGEFAITYYGRDTGSLAGQLLTLPPGRYRFGYALVGGPANTRGALSWTLACADAPAAPVLLDAPLPAPANAPRRYEVQFTVPAGCRAQQLTLRGNAAEFPTEINVTISALTLGSAGPRA